MNSFFKSKNSKRLNFYDFIFCQKIKQRKTNDGYFFLPFDNNGDDDTAKFYFSQRFVNNLKVYKKIKNNSSVSVFYLSSGGNIHVFTGTACGAFSNSFRFLKLFNDESKTYFNFLPSSPLVIYVSIS